MRTPAKYFRAGTGAVIFDRTGRVLICERKDIQGAWQFPQGGLEKGETALRSVLREIGEETGIPSTFAPIDSSISRTARIRASA